MRLIEELERWFRPYRTRLNNMIRRAVVVSATDSPAVQQLKINLGNGDIQSKIERIQNFGLTGVPKKNAQALCLFVNGNRDQPVIIAVDDGNFRVHVNEGEVAVYNAFGTVIKLAADGTINMGDGSPLLATAGVVTGECLDPFTGAPHADKSAIVKAKKV
jgi:phage baseplate assembly protein V